MASSKILETLLEIPENRQCADCKCRNPRWASITFGIFVCIDCSGFHRRMGTHIAKIKSVTLDSWTDEMLFIYGKMNNGIANQYWEANMNEAVRPHKGNNGYALEEFITDKYQNKRYADKNDINPVQKILKGEQITPIQKKEQPIQSSNYKKAGFDLNFSQKRYQTEQKQNVSSNQRQKQVQIDQKAFQVPIPQNNSQNLNKQFQQQKNQPIQQQQASSSHTIDLISFQPENENQREEKVEQEIKSMQEDIILENQTKKDINDLMELNWDEPQDKVASNVQFEQKPQIFSDKPQLLYAQQQVQSNEVNQIEEDKQQQTSVTNAILNLYNSISINNYSQPQQNQKNSFIPEGMLVAQNYAYQQQNMYSSIQNGYYQTNAQQFQPVIMNMPAYTYYNSGNWGNR